MLFPASCFIFILTSFPVLNIALAFSQCAYNVLFAVVAHAVAVLYPLTAVPVKLPSAFNILLPSLAAVYHPVNVYPVLVAVGAVAAVVPVFVVYNVVASFFAYSGLVPLNVPLFLLNVIVAAVNFTYILLLHVAVVLVNVPSVAYACTL